MREALLLSDRDICLLIIPPYTVGNLSSTKPQTYLTFIRREISRIGERNTVHNLSFVTLRNARKFLIIL